MRILLAASCSSDPNLGVPGVMHSLADEWRSMGHEVRMVFRDRPGRLGEVLFPWRLAVSSDVRWADVVDVHAAEAWPLAARRNRPVVVARSHGLEIGVHRRLLSARDRGEARISPVYWTYRGSLRLLQERRAIRSADAALVLNASDRGICLDEFRADPRRVHLVPNGFPEAFLEREILPGDGLAFVGSWLARKGNDVLVNALSGILSVRPDAKVLIAGTGVPKEVVLGDFPEEVRPRLEVVPRFPRSELPDLLARRGILLFPSRSEGSPLSLLEAMACGLVPVASAIPGVVEVLRDGENGLLFPSEDASALEAKVLDLMERQDLAARLRVAARNSVRGRSWAGIARDQAALFEGLRRQRGAASR